MRAWLSVLQQTGNSTPAQPRDNHAIDFQPLCIVNFVAYATDIVTRRKECDQNEASVNLATLSR